jgi:uncharacterized protein (DUF1697 family)
MHVMVALLRGVNVGGANKLPMADLRRIAEGCGYQQVKTYIQSGNIVLAAGDGDTAKAGGKLRRAIAERSGLDPAVIVRSRDELAAVVDANPFLHRGEDPAHLHVVFMEEASPLPLKDLDAYAPEEVEVVGRERYLFLPKGLGRSRLAADLSRPKSPQGTARNWRTVTKLLEMADEIARSLG